MDEETSSKDKIQDPSKRKFIKSLAVLGLAAATGQLTTACSPDDETPSKTPDPKAKTTQVPAQAKPVEQKPSVIKSKDPHSVTNEGLFINWAEEEGIEVQRRVKEQILYYQRSGDLSKRIKDSKSWEAAIRLQADKFGFTPNSPVRSYLSALIFVESEGNPAARSGGAADARGLCQITPETASEAYLTWMTADDRRKMGISYNKPDDLFNTNTNIVLALQTLQHYHECFDDPSLYFWAYHLGPKTMSQVIQVYLVETKQMSQTELDRRLKTTPFGTNPLVIDFQLNYAKLITNPGVRKFLGLDDPKKKDYLNDTEHYVSRLAAARYFLTK